MRNRALAHATFIIGIVLGASGTARAQTDAETAAAPLPVFRLPVLSASIGIGTVADSPAGGAVKTVSTEFFLMRQFLVQAEFTRASSSWNRTTPVQLRIPTGGPVLAHSVDIGSERFSI